MSTYDLALPVKRGRVAPYGTRAQMTTSTGEIEGYLAFAGFNRKAKTASYALRVINRSRNILTAKMSCARLRGEGPKECPLDMEIGPFSISETLLPVRIPDVGPYDRAIVKISGNDVAFSLEAPAPARSVRKKKRYPLLIAAGAAIAVGCGLGAAQAQPRLQTFASPQRIVAGAPIAVPYSFGGWASMQYALQTADGRQIDAGISTLHQGTLRFKVPSGIGSSVTLLATVSGPFGNRQIQKQIQITNVVAKRKAQIAPPRIDSLSIATPVARAGQPLYVKYVTNAASGEIWLVDPAGKLWAKADLLADGESSLNVPEGAGGQQMRVVLRAHRGTADALSSVGVLIMPSPVTPNAPATAKNVSSLSATLSLSTQNAAPGEDVVVTLQGAHGDARISLTDATGNTIETGDVPSGQSAVTLQAPSASTTTTYYVVANVSEGSSEQSLVQKLTVTPR